MKMNRLFKLLPLIALALILSACGGAPAAGSWPGISYDEASQQVYVAYNQHAYALQAENGLARWRFPAEPQGGFATYAAPHLTEDGQLLIAGYDHSMHSVNPETGAQNWIFNGASSRFIAAPLALGERIFAPNANHVMYILNADGSLARTFGTLEPQWGSPVTDGTAVYLTAMDHQLYAIDAETGEEAWSVDLGGTIVGSPVLGEDGRLYVGTLNSTVVAVDTASRDIAWTFETTGWVWASPLIVDDVVVVGDLDGFLYAIDAESGTQVWQVETGGAITGAAALFEGELYVVNEAGSLLSVSLDGRTRELALPEDYDGPLYGSPVAAGELLLIGLTNNASIVIALDAGGSVVWKFTPQN
jgi:outer membrane protein assembly factor BamB